MTDPDVSHIVAQDTTTTDFTASRILSPVHNLQNQKVKVGHFTILPIQESYRVAMLAARCSYLQSEIGGYNLIFSMPSKQPSK